MLRDKVKIFSLLQDYKYKRKLTLRELQSLLGLLNFAWCVIVHGCSFLRRLFDLTKCHTCPHYRITLNSEARLYFILWHDLLKIQ